MEESEEKFYYDIPIKDFKKKSGNHFNPNANPKATHNTHNENEEDSSKKRMIEEILKDTNNTLSMVDKDRPFTPPFTKLVPMTSLRSLDKAAVIIEKAKEELMCSQIVTHANDNEDEVLGDNSSANNKDKDKDGDISDKIGKTDKGGNKLLDSIEQSYQFNDNNYLDLIYDHVLGCYYDPKTNMYYELKG